MQTLYNTDRLVTRFGIRLITSLGIVLCIIGVAGIVLSIIDLFHGRPKVHHYEENQGGLKIENPLWPSSGKGFWVGLILLATGLVGILASREQTPVSYMAFTILSGLSTILSFYLIITSIIPVLYDTNNSEDPTPRWLLNELIINSLLIAVGGFGSIVGIISALIGSIGAGYWYDQRRIYADLYSDDPTRIL